jgi:glutamate 5-kinase
VEELKFGDNDMLSAMVAAKMDADLLVVLTNVPGLMTGHPTEDPTARLIPVIDQVDAAVEGLVQAGKSEHGTGGMTTKLMAARHANQFGVCCVVANGTEPGQLAGILKGDFVGTFFRAKSTRKAGSSRRHWIYARRTRGDIHVDEGAARALATGGKSLLAVGITAVEGSFEKGDIVRILGPDGTEIGRGITNYNIATIADVKGKKSVDLAIAHPEMDYPEIIHRDNIALG